MTTIAPNNNDDETAAEAKLRDSIMESLEKEDSEKGEEDQHLGIIILQEEAGECRVRVVDGKQSGDGGAKKSKDAAAAAAEEEVQVIVMGNEPNKLCDACGKVDCGEDHNGKHKTAEPATKEIVDGKKSSNDGADKKSNKGAAVAEEEEEVQVIVMGNEPPKACDSCGKVDCDEDHDHKKEKADEEEDEVRVIVMGSEPSKRCDSCGKADCEEDHDKEKEVDKRKGVTDTSTVAGTTKDAMEVETPSKVDGNKNKEPSTPESSSKKQPYKVKMNIHQRWNGFFDKLKAFHAEHNTWNVTTTNDKSLERWVNRQRSTFHRGQLKAKRLQALKDINFDFGQPPKHKGDTWITTKPWHERFEQLMEFKAWHGHCKGKQKQGMKQ